ncbi:hypothetical protein ACFFX0_08160 [Citricoccus parietis]|uniref:Uncharacterized protein n=1 Tax=Citricoccus parietis TaxID=592307 RepID=A0ABV5FWZ4_9MICC
MRRISPCPGRPPRRSSTGMRCSAARWTCCAMAMCPWRACPSSQTRRRWPM